MLKRYFRATIVRKETYMGQFSWKYADDGRRAVKDNKCADTYLLVPEPFQQKYGKAIYEDCYDGYGHFGSYDVYDLVVEWNREIIPEIVSKMKAGEWRCSIFKNGIENLRNYYDGKKLTMPQRDLGIMLACYDEDNFSLKYPIKITMREMEYAKARPSKSDPNQGW